MTAKDSNPLGTNATGGAGTRYEIPGGDRGVMVFIEVGSPTGSGSFHKGAYAKFQLSGKLAGDLPKKFWVPLDGNPEINGPIAELPTVAQGWLDGSSSGGTPAGEIDFPGVGAGE